MDLGDAQAWNLIGATPMIGQNDVRGEVTRPKAEPLRVFTNCPTVLPVSGSTRIARPSSRRKTGGVTSPARGSRPGKASRVFSSVCTSSVIV